MANLEPVTPEDPLEKIMSAKRLRLTIAGKELTICKWSLREGFRVSGKLVTLIRKALPNLSAADLLNVDLEPLIEEHFDDVMEILVVSIKRGNFETEDETREWLEGSESEVTFEEVLDLGIQMGKLNLRPLMRKLESLGSVTSLMDQTETPPAPTSEPEVPCESPT